MLRNHFREIKQNIERFCASQYRSVFFRNIFITAAFCVVFFVTFLVIYPFVPAAAFFPLAGANLLLLILFFIFFWRAFYRTVIPTALQMDTIKEKYDLLETRQLDGYSESLLYIMDLIDSSLERQYSSRLLQKQAELDALQSQINPHFLYNTLDTIRGYALMEDASLTADMVEVLSRLFRYMISQKHTQVTLRQELSILQDYIKIMEYRLNQNIVFIQNIDPDLQVMNYEIPKLIIQPFIENAVQHGHAATEKELIITLSIFRTQSRLMINIADNGLGMSPDQLLALNQKLAGSEIQFSSSFSGKKKGSGIALTNVNARIRLLYGDDYGVTAFSTQGKGTKFQIALPYHSDYPGGTEHAAGSLASDSH